MEQGANGLAQNGMNEIGSNIGQWNQNKIALMQARMRDDQRGGGENQVIIKQDVNINQTRAVAKGGLASQVGFQLFQEGE